MVEFAITIDDPEQISGLLADMCAQNALGGEKFINLHDYVQFLMVRLAMACSQHHGFIDRLNCS